MNEPRKLRRPPPPLTQQRLEELALHYVGRFATTRAKLRSYLNRKLRERGWDDEREPDTGAIAERMAANGYIDDSAYALSKAQSLSASGYGTRRLVQKLHAAGVASDDSAPARELSDAQAVAAAIRFAQRRRLGPFANEAADPHDREKALAAMIRAGHGFALSKAILVLAPGDPVDVEALEANNRLIAS